MKRYQRIPYDSQMKESEKRLFIGKSESHGPSALHVPETDNLGIGICGRVIIKITNPSKYGPFCLNCKHRFYKT